MINQKQKKFELVISSENVISTDERFTMNNLYIGDNYKPLDVYFQKANGKKLSVNVRKRSEIAPIKRYLELLVRCLKVS